VCGCVGEGVGVCVCGGVWVCGWDHWCRLSVATDVSCLLRRKNYSSAQFKLGYYRFVAAQFITQIRKLMGRRRNNLV
jgi:hypothetical protein